MTAPVPNTPLAGKAAILAAGAAVGVGLTLGARAAFVEPDRAAELEAKGTPALDSRTVSTYAIAMPFGAAAGVALGMQRRSPTAGLTTATQIAASALLSTVAGAAINAGTDKANDYVIGVGTMAAATGAGILLGVRDEVKPGRARMKGLALFGVAMGAALPMLFETAKAIPAHVQGGWEHRER